MEIPHVYTLGACMKRVYLFFITQKHKANIDGGDISVDFRKLITGICLGSIQ